MLFKPKKLYKIIYGYPTPNEFTFIKARDAAKAMRKFEKRHYLASVHSIERVEDF